MRSLVFGLVIALASPAIAQRGPSFDCSKASNIIERTICKEPELATADRDLAAIYGALAGRLAAPAKEHLAKDQVRWITDRNRDCAAEPDDVAVCLRNRYTARTATLKAFGDGAYPFISTQTLARKGKLGEIRYSYRIEYPQFDGTTATFSGLNASFAAAARKAADQSIPKDSDNGPGWTFEQTFEIYRPSADAVTIGEIYDSYQGGAHPNGGTDCVLVDLRSGRSAGPDGVFAGGDGWLKMMVELVGADLKKQFVEKPGFEDALESKNLAKLLREARHYCWKANQLELIFNAYEVGPYAAGPYEVVVPYDRLRAQLRPGGPITR